MKRSRLSRKGSKARKSRMEYLTKAKMLIDKDDPFIYDVAVNMFPAQIVGNVKHTRIFLEAVADAVEEDDKRPVFISEPYGLPRELQSTGKFKRLKK